MNLQKLAEMVTEGFQLIFDRFVETNKRIDALELEIARLQRKPHQPFRQKLKERGE